MADTRDFAGWMASGSALYEAGNLAPALVAFQSALAQAPQELQAINAVATLLSELDQPAAAYKVLADAKHLLWDDADGIANLAIAAEACGQDKEAAQAYQRALALEPNHVRSLNNLAIRAAHSGDWDSATSHMARCVTLMPEEPLLWKNQADFLTGARREAQALAQLELACARFPDSLDLAIRRMVSLAFNGQLEASDRAFAALGPQASDILANFLREAIASLPRHMQKQSTAVPDAFEFYCLRSFDGLNVCQWRGQDRLVALLAERLERAEATGEVRDWRDTQFYALFLALSEDQQVRIRAVAARTILKAQQGNPHWTPYVARALTGARQADTRLRIGVSTQDLADPRYGNALLRQLQLHDRSAFSFYLYSPAPLVDPSVKQRFQDVCTSVVDIAHMSTAESVGRIRLDRLDLWLDTALYTAWCRAEIPFWRVAPVQMRHQNWIRLHAPFPCDYSVGDPFTHPDAPDYNRYGSVVRFSQNCWLALPAANPILPSAESVALAQAPANAFAFCFQGYALHIDPYTFSQWMAVLKGAEHAVLWLPAYNAPTRANLQREAQAAGVAPERLVFKVRSGGPGNTHPMAGAQLFLDTLRFNANDTLVDALHAGLPALTVAGHSMASRLGGSILCAAGLPQCVLPSAADYVARAIDLAHQPQKLAALKARLASSQATAPLFDTQARVKEWEAAWRHMVERSRQGLAPAAFDVPAS